MAISGAVSRRRWLAILRRAASLVGLGEFGGPATAMRVQLCLDVDQADQAISRECPEVVLDA